MGFSVTSTFDDCVCLLSEDGMQNVFWCKI